MRVRGGSLAATAAVLTVVLTVAACGRPPSPSSSATPASGGGTVTAMPAGLDKIDHFVFIMQENRSFDSYFGTYPGADGIPAGVTVPGPLGNRVAPFHDPNDVNRGGPHGWDNSAADVDGGKMDGFLLQSWRSFRGRAFAPGATAGGNPRDVLGWHDWREIPNYWSYAKLYALQDRLFESVSSYSLPAHLYMLAAQSGGYVGRTANGTVQPIPAQYDFPEITELLQSGKIDWKYYVTAGTQPDVEDGHIVNVLPQQSQSPKTYSLWNPLPAFPQVRGDAGQWNRLVDTSEFYSDCATGKLPQVSWVIPSGQVSEHPPAKVSTGMAYVTGLVNAVMSGPDWNHTAIFIAWDDWGGFYDHVPPPSVDEFGYGLRVPGLVISPYAKQGFIDHKTASFESWLKLVEERYGVRSLTARDSSAYDMADAFDFTQQPRAPVLLSATPAGSPYPPAPQQ
jgi:phospholipase C